MNLDLKALSCKHVGRDTCPYNDEPPILKAALLSQLGITKNVDITLSPYNEIQLYRFCIECPEYYNEQSKLTA